MKDRIRSIFLWLNIKRISFMAAMLFGLSMLPNWYLAFIARPTGDDYGYSAATHQTWLATHSLFATLQTSLETTWNMCQVWNGDWFSVFLFTLMPEVFVPRSFWIVPLFWSGATILATWYFFHELLVNRLELKTSEAALVTILVLVMCYQWVFSSRAVMYWYVGVIHYTMPYVLSLLLLGFFSKFLRTEKKRYIIYSILGMIAIGGSSYYSAFLVLLTYLLVLFCIAGKNKMSLWILLPMAAGAAALYMQIMAPGNAARVGEGIKATETKLVATIFEALGRGVTAILSYMQEKPFMFVLLFLLAIFLWECMSQVKLDFRFKYPLLFVGYMYGIFASLFTPEIYADTEISGGPPSIEYFTFILLAAVSILYIEGWLMTKLRKKGNQKTREQYHLYLTIPALIFSCFMLIGLRSTLKETLFYESWQYIASGSAADFKEQMDSQLEILLDDSVKEAYLCPTNDVQGPLMHMPATEDPDAFTNRTLRQFYGKELVIVKPDDLE